MGRARARRDCEVAVIGAGPYGLAVAAHLKAAHTSTRLFGQPMSFWRNNMPAGMKLQSDWHASHIAHPEGRFSLDAFAHQHGLPAPQPQQPVEQFIRYGEWFSRQAIPDLEPLAVRRVEHIGSGFCLALENGETAQADRIVVATGMACHAFVPPQFHGLPSALVSHSSSQTDLTRWHGRRVAVVGRGQSACEAAALLQEAGSEVELIGRGPLAWTADCAEESVRGWRGRFSRLLRCPAALGPVPLNLLNKMPDLEHRIPKRARAWINRRSLRSKAASWLKPRLAAVTIEQGRQILSVSVERGRIILHLDSESRGYDHVLLATGFKIDISRCKLLASTLRAAIACIDGSPLLVEGFESTVPALHFVGPSSVASYGPLMRFIAGTGYTARSITETHLRQTARASLERLYWRQSDLLDNSSEENPGATPGALYRAITWLRAQT